MTAGVRRGLVITGALAARPLYGEAGRTFIDTDTGTQYRDTGSAWVENPAGPQGPPGPAPACSGTKFVRVVGGVLEDPATVAFGAGAGQVAEGNHTHGGGAEVLKGVYSFCLTDLAGVATANYVYLVIWNPTGSGRRIRLRKADLCSYAVALTIAKASLAIVRILGVPTGGTMQSSYNVAKHLSTYRQAQAWIWTANPTVARFENIKAFAPAVTITAANPVMSREMDYNPPENDTICQLMEGQGIAIFNAVAGTVAETFNIRLMWAEYEVT